MNGIEKNDNFISEDGVIFSKDMTQLVRYPSGNERNYYIIPNNVTTILEISFKESKNLESIIISNKVEEIQEYSFELCTKLTNILVEIPSITCWNNVFYLIENEINIQVRHDFSNDFCGKEVNRTDLKCGDNVYYMKDEISGYLYLYGEGDTNSYN